MFYLGTMSPELYLALEAQRRRELLEAADRGRLAALIARGRTRRARRRPGWWRPRWWSWARHARRGGAPACIGPAGPVHRVDHVELVGPGATWGRSHAA